MKRIMGEIITITRIDKSVGIDCRAGCCPANRGVKPACEKFTPSVRKSLEQSVAMADELSKQLQFFRAVVSKP